MTDLPTLAAISTLLIASAYDYRYRRVPDKLWLIMTPLTFYLVAISPSYTLAQAPTHLLLILATFGATFLLSAAQVFGGADWKGITYIAIATPPSYYAPVAGLIHPTIDAVIPGLVVGEILRRLQKAGHWPFFLTYSPFVALALASEWTVWRAPLWLLGLLV